MTPTQRPPDVETPGSGPASALRAGPVISGTAARETALPDGPKLNLGCGPVQPEGWVNIDGSNRAFLVSRFNWLDRFLVTLGLIPSTDFKKSIRHHNLFKGLPYPDNAVACIYAGELWEHFEHADGIALTRECHRVLKPGGVLRVCVPDGPAFWRRYLALYEDEQAKPPQDRSARALIAHTQLFFNEICTRRQYLGSMGHTHKWNFDDVQLVDMFRTAGFPDPRRMKFRDSRIPDIHQVERSDFLIVEAVKQAAVPR